MKEWDNPYNSFNSWKGLLFAPWYQSIKDWRDGKISSPRAPIEVSLDPINACQLACSHCNASKYLEDENKDQRRIPDEMIPELVEFLARWGVKAICWGGGGEPTLHTKLADGMLLAKKFGVENSIATNGINFNDRLIDVVTDTCRWVGVSVDSATPETYLKGRGRDKFGSTVENIRKLSDVSKEKKTNCDVAFKFLLFEYNQHEVFEACKLAKSLGVKDFHVRPADLTHQGMHDKYKGKATPYDIESIKAQFEKCHELADENFRVFTIVHKFNPDFSPIKKFDNCYASPCCIQICPSGDCYLCPDSRYDERYKLGSWNPPEQILEWWGSKKHYDLVFNSGKKMCNTRCTFNPYNIQCQELFMKDSDPLCWKFI